MIRTGPGWSDHLYAVDTGLERTLGATRVVVAVVLGAALLVPTSNVLGLPIGVAMVGAVVALAVAMQVDEDEPRALGLTALLCGLSGSLGVALSTLAASRPWMAYAVFVAVLTGATWARRFGSRGRTVGTVAFVSSLFTIFVGAASSTVPWLCASVGCGALVAAVTRAFLVPDCTGARLRRSIHSLVVRASRLSTSQDSQDALDDVLLAVRDQLDRAGPAVFRDVDDARSRLLRLAVIADHLAGPHARHDRARGDAMPLPSVRRRLHEQVTALQALTVGEGRHPKCPHRQRAEAVSPGRLEGHDIERSSMAPDTRAAVQVAIAGTLAVLFGVLVSPQRWYWAVVAAFVVFANTTSRGATVRKALERTLGTLLGVVIGLLVAGVLPNSTVALVLGAVLLFAAMWIAQASYTLMIGAITVVLALLYDVMGILTLDVVNTRIAETAVGAAVGTVVAVLVLPVRTGEHVRNAAAAVLDAISDVVRHLGDTNAGPQREGMLKAVKVLDVAHEDLRVAVAPFVGVIRGQTARDMRHLALLVAAARYWARRLALAAVRGGRTPEGPHDQVARWTRELAESLRDRSSLPTFCPDEGLGELSTITEILGAIGQHAGDEDRGRREPCDPAS